MGCRRARPHRSAQSNGNYNYHEVALFGKTFGAWPQACLVFLSSLLLNFRTASVVKANI